MTEASDEQIAALSKEIRAIGRSVRWFRTAVAGAFFVFWVLCFGAWHGRDRPELLPLGGVPLAIAATLLMAALYRGLFLDGLRRRLRPLTDEQRIVLLRPLRETSTGDTRKLVDGLMRDWRVPTEVSPADAPTGRGDEPTPWSGRAQRPWSSVRREHARPRR